MSVTSAPLNITSASRAHPRDLSIDYLRTTLTLMVLGHHSSLAYTTFAYFDPQHFTRSTAPIVDNTRWLFFDYAENFNDVFFMSLMFFVSGLFVYSALKRHGTFGFIRDRFLRLGLPFAAAVTLVMPIAYFASWQVAGKVTGQNHGFFDFYRRLAAAHFIAGPPWFVWLLLLFDVVLALVLLPFRATLPAFAPFMQRLKDHPFATFAVMFILSAALYLPLLARYGFGAWTNLFTAPFSFQICRIGLYSLWFVFGFLIGIPGFTNGLLATDGPLARRWRWWIAACFLAYNALVVVLRMPVIQHLPAAVRIPLEPVLWVASCTASCFGFLALFRGLHLTSRPWMNSLSRSAYIMYLVHYFFITWTQRLMLGLPIHAAIKFLFVFLSTVLLSWLTAQVLLRIPKLKSIL
jgi:glucans biosynthesis protein C